MSTRCSFSTNLASGNIVNIFAVLSVAVWRCHNNYTLLFCGQKPVLKCPISSGFIREIFYNVEFNFHMQKFWYSQLLYFCRAHLGLLPNDVWENNFYFHRFTSGSDTQRRQKRKKRWGYLLEILHAERQGMVSIGPSVTSMLFKHSSGKWGAEPPPPQI